MDSSVGDITAAALARFFTLATGSAYTAAVDESVVKEIIAGIIAQGSLGLGTPISTTPTLGTLGDVFYSAINWNKGRKAVVNVAGTWKLQVYKYDDPNTVWRTFDLDHSTNPSNVVPA